MNGRRALGIVLRVMVPLILAPLLAVSALPKDTRLGLQQVDRAIDAGRLLEAAGLLEQAAQFFPWRADLWEAAGHKALAGGDPAKAVHLFQAAGQGRLSPSGIAALGDAYLALGQKAQALAAWEQAASLVAQPASLYMQMLDIHRSQRDYSAMIQDLQALTSYIPDDASLFFELGMILAATRPEDARPYLKRAAELDPSLKSRTGTVDQAIRAAGVKDEPAYQLLHSGRALAATEEWELASEAFYQAVQIRPDYAEAWAFLGEAYQHTGSEADADKAIEALQTALRIDPNSIAAHSLIALSYERRGEHDLAIAHLESAASLDPDNPIWWVEMGRAAGAADDLEAALGYYQQAIQRAPNIPDYWEALAEFTLQNHLRVREVGLPAARQAVALAPQDARALDVMGETLLSLGDYAGAERFLLRALLADQNYAPAHLHLGMTYLLLGNYNEARGQLENVLGLAPDTPAASHAGRLLERYYP